LLALILAEALLITLAGTVLAMVLLSLATALSSNLLAERLSLFIEANLLTSQSISHLLVVIAGALVISLVPGVAAYRRALHQQLA